MAYNETPQVEESDQEAAAIINRNIEEAPDGASSPEQIQEAIKEDIDGVKGETRTQVQAYLAGMKEATKGAQVEKLEDGTGGLYDGTNQKIAKSTLEASGSIKETVARMKEVGDHEAYHAENKHLEAMKSADRGDGDVLQLGGKSFKTDTPLIEGLTVNDTGDSFVSDQYVQYKEDLVGAASAAGVSMEEVRTAVNEKKDLTLIDDRTRDKTAGEVQFAMAS